MIFELVIPTPYETIADFAMGFVERTEASGVRLPSAQPIDLGATLRFTVTLADGSPALVGQGMITDVIELGVEDFDLVVAGLQLEPVSEILFERLQMSRESLVGESPPTASVAIPIPIESAPPVSQIDVALPSEPPRTNEAIRISSSIPADDDVVLSVPPDALHTVPPQPSAAGVSSGSRPSPPTRVHEETTVTIAVPKFAPPPAFGATAGAPKLPPRPAGPPRPASGGRAVKPAPRPGDGPKSQVFSDALTRVHDLSALAESAERGVDSAEHDVRTIQEPAPHAHDTATHRIDVSNLPRSETNSDVPAPPTTQPDRTMETRLPDFDESEDVKLDE